MADAERVTARQRAILTAIIESYIETGEPVGSGTIARLQNSESSGLSSATVRNEMAELAEEGDAGRRDAEEEGDTGVVGGGLACLSAWMCWRKTKARRWETRV